MIPQPEFVQHKSMSSTNDNKNKLWVDAARSLLDRLLTSTSYSFVSQIQVSLNSLQGYASRDFFALASVCLFSAAAVGLKRSSVGLKRVCSMLAAHSVTSTIPIPQEQNSKLVLPGIMLYLSSIATLNWVILFCIGKVNENVMETISSIIDYVVLFAASRGLARFKASSEMHTLGVISLVFLIFPKHLYNNTSSTKPPKTEKSRPLWTDQILNLLESLAIRGVVIWTTSSIKLLTGVSGATSIVLLNWAILIWNPFRITSKLAECENVLSFMNAEQTTDLFQTYMHNTVSATVFLVFLFLFIQSRVCPHPVCAVCRLGVSISMTSWLEMLVGEVFKWIERLIVYTLVFIILEYLIKEVEKHNLTSTTSTGSDNMIITMNSNQTLESEEQEEKSNFGIAHAQSTLGLPIVLDSGGNH